jgi:hypothetical protein
VSDVTFCLKDQIIYLFGEICPFICVIWHDSPTVYLVAFTLCEASNNNFYIIDLSNNVEICFFPLYIQVICILLMSCFHISSNEMNEHNLTHVFCILQNLTKGVPLFF